MISSIQLKNIRKKYKSSNFNLYIDRLEFRNDNIHVIVGPNGSGKSSLLKLIALFDRPDGGDILFNSNVNGSLRKKTGFIMQNPYLFSMNVLDNIAIGLKIRRFPKNEIVSRVRNILKVLRIEHLADRKAVRDLSRGEYQKAAIAQVLVLEPEIILMDEPVANIDKESTLNIEEVIKNAQKRFNPVIIMTTHSLTQARRLSDKIISIHEGRLINGGVV